MQNFDYLVIGSGFGGSVSALRLAEKGYSVCLLERGKRFEDHDFAKTSWNLKRYLWLPLFKCFGIQNLSLFKNILVLSGCGVGGGSLVYANTLLQPSDDFFVAPAWKDLADWKSELLPFYTIAKQMLGVATNPKLTYADSILKECAKDLGREDTFRPSEVGVFFGKPGETVEDPYFKGKGPARSGCVFCGGCMVGCRYNAKNTLVKNYLYFAEQKGVRIIPERTAISITPNEKGYEVKTECSTAWIAKNPETFQARNVICSAGVLGTLNLLLRCKYLTKTLPNISDRLGHDVMTNGETLVGCSRIRHLKDAETVNHTEGIAISSIFHADQHTHVEPVRYSHGSNFMRILATPMIDNGGRFTRPLLWLANLIIHPIRAFRFFFVRNWSQNTIILLVMQTLDFKLQFKLGRSFLTLFRKKIITAPELLGTQIPSFIPIANQIARLFAKKTHSEPGSAVNEIVLQVPTTAHILGGCKIGKDSLVGVVGANHEVFGYPGLFICDGSVIPANLGVNPSLTITAMTERAIAKIPDNG